GKTDLVLGDQSGILKVVSDFREAIDATGASEEIIFNPLSSSYESVNLGGHIWPVASNLFGTTKPALIVGSVLGGLFILRHDEGESLPETPSIEVYPNPVAKNATLTIKIGRPGTLQIFSTLGQEVTVPYYLPASEEIVYQLPHMAAGVYICKFLINNRSYTRRIVIY
ncbi:MAG TPA: T9SS type A sorting domain-containing protein, partial [Chryseolinea sp.]|nr:T9SS type A sorting domain-containing protein [Chryseolinea sp.]